MKSVFALSLLATAFVVSASASADSHNVALERRAAGHALPAKRFVKRTIRLGARESGLLARGEMGAERECVPKLTLDARFDLLQLMETGAKIPDVGE